MAGAIWSASPQQIADYPFQAFVKFFANHKLFDLVSRPDWQTIKGGARSYVERLVDDGRFTTRLASPVQHLKRDGLGVDVFFADGSQERFEHVVLATHADQALRLLADPSRAETDLLSPFRTSANQVYLHRDRALMPRHKRFWSAWNYQGNGGDDESRLAVTYWMNELQQLETPEQHFVSLNPVTPPDPALVDGQHLYRHPIFNAQTLAAQQQLWHLQGARRTWFCGAWFGAGFHEDGAQAGLAVAEQLGDLSRPWSVAEPSGRIHVHELPRSVRPGYVEAAE
jgi:predicted NAD/FAD-binding protein